MITTIHIIHVSHFFRIDIFVLAKSHHTADSEMKTFFLSFFYLLQFAKQKPIDIWFLFEVTIFV